MRYLLLFFVVSLLLLPASSDACDPIPVYFTQEDVVADTYVIIKVDTQAGSEECYGHDLARAYTFDISPTCSTSSLVSGAGYVEGTNLSGIYKVSSSGQGCNTLCACTP